MLGLHGCGGSSADSKTQQAPPPAPVTAVKALAEDIPDYRYYPAITQAVLEAQIVARVEGFLEQRDFIEGDDVVAGQRLYLIQQEEYIAGLIQAKAALANAEAELEFDRYTYEQTKRNYEGGGGTVYEVDEARASLRETEADVEAARAQVLNAELDLSYTEVIAPFDGRISETEVNIGNLVGAGTSAQELATLVMLDPMRVIFEPAGTELVQYLEAFPSTTVPVQITVRETGGEQQIFNGALDLVNNTVNQETSTFLARGVFANPDRLVLPGLYVSARVRIRTIEGAVMVPDEAMSSTPTSQYVYVVDSKQVLQKRTVQTASLYDGPRHVTSGLKAGDVVVVKGNPMMVRQGATVKVDLVDAHTFVTDQQKQEESATAESAGTSGSSSSTDDSTGDADGSSDGS